MDLRNVEVQEGGVPWRWSKRKLERALQELPIDICGRGLKLKAHMGSGKIVYIRPTSGFVTDVNFEEPVVADQPGVSWGITLYYKNQMYEIDYGYKPGELADVVLH